MTAWQLVIMLFVGGLGAMAFLKAVADELVVVAQELNGLRERERLRASQLRRAAASTEEWPRAAA